jgi:4-diphosphocytidyl-2-C-methyl-D-erythritol kinase
MAYTTTNNWPAPAKLNLFLHITGRRPDGYHLLQTVFQFIDYCDTLSFKVRNDGIIHRTNEIPGVTAEKDLITRAAQLLQRTSGTHLGVDIQIDKRIPIGGGLGGGSSDAATTLIALNQVWEMGLSQSQLLGLGMQLGADVPVFISGQASWAEGIGEKLTPVSLPEPWYVIIAPPCQVDTAAVFNKLELTRDCHPIRIENFLSGRGVNVCEPVVCQEYPQVRDALEWLSEFAKTRMSGTGACVFAPFSKRDEADTVLNKLPAGWVGFIAKGINRSPLFDMTRRT